MNIEILKGNEAEKAMDSFSQVSKFLAGDKSADFFAPSPEDAFPFTVIASREIMESGARKYVVRATRGDEEFRAVYMLGEISTDRYWCCETPSHVELCFLEVRRYDLPDGRIAEIEHIRRELKSLEDLGEEFQPELRLWNSPATMGF